MPWWRWRRLTSPQTRTPTGPRWWSRRLLCDGRLQTVVNDPTGHTAGIGTARTAPGWILRQLRWRDRGCTFPGCYPVPFVSLTMASTTSSSRPVRLKTRRWRSAPVPRRKVARTRSATSSQSSLASR